jgi:Zn ribbon nucleic-acid-binding protein
MPASRLRYPHAPQTPASATCPKCDSTNTRTTLATFQDDGTQGWFCAACGHWWDTTVRTVAFSLCQ